MSKECNYCQGNLSVLTIDNCQDGNLVVYIDFNEIVADNGETYYGRGKLTIVPFVDET